MILSPPEILGMIAAVAAGTILTRFVPFILFAARNKPPRFVIYLGRVLPPAMIGLLVVYCFKSVSLLESPHGLPEGMAAMLTVILHLWKGNVFLSIGAGTACYMFLVQSVFV